MARSLLRGWCLLGLAAAVTAVAPTSSECSSSQQLLMHAESSGTVQGLINSTLAPACQQVYYISGSACSASSYLALELWDLEQSADMVGGSTSDSSRAQPFLVAARGIAPQGFYNATSSSWTFVPSSSLSDVAGQSLLRPYLQVQSTFGAATSIQIAAAEVNCTAANPCWYATILNSQALMSHELRYQLRATCSTSPQCPAPEWTGNSTATEPCSGNGRCQVALVPPPLDVICVCNPGWGDVGCSKPLSQLTGGEAVGNAALAAGSWEYYAVSLPQGSSTLLVQMSRTRGDPILFLKGLNEGFEPGALPSTLDYSTFADRNSWRERADNAQLLRTNATPGQYYVGIFNNNDDIQEPANFTLEASWSSRASPICPWDCHGNGRCTLPGICDCNSGYGGLYCDGTLAAIHFSQGVSGTLQPGIWSYYSLDLSDPVSRQQAVTVDFSNNAGQGIILASFGNYPTLLNANFTFRAGQMVGAVSQVVQPGNLISGVLYIGIYNMDYYVHSPFNYTLEVMQTKASRNSYTPWISVGVALGVCGTLGFLIFQCHRAWLRRRAGARGWAVWSWRRMPALPPPHRRRRAERRRGLDPALFQTFPTYTHDAGKLARGESQTPKTPVPSEDEKLCSVCLCEYEDEDLIRQLLPCRHDFHCKCIDQWLMKNSTCPMCRVSLIPEGYVPSIERQSVGGGFSVIPEENPQQGEGNPADIQLTQMERGEEASPAPSESRSSESGESNLESSESFVEEPAVAAPLPDPACDDTVASSSRSDLEQPSAQREAARLEEGAGPAGDAAAGNEVSAPQQRGGLSALKRWLPKRKREAPQRL